MLRKCNIFLVLLMLAGCGQRAVTSEEAPVSKEFVKVEKAVHRLELTVLEQYYEKIALLEWHEKMAACDGGGKK